MYIYAQKSPFLGIKGSKRNKERMENLRSGGELFCRNSETKKKLQRKKRERENRA